MTVGGMAVTRELRERTRFGLQTFATVGLNPNTVWGVNNALIPQPLPLAVLRGKFQEETSLEQAKKTFVAEFNKLQEEMKKKAKDLKKPEVKAEIAKLIDEFVKKHGLTRGASTAAHDKYSLLNDPGLKELKERYYKDTSNASDKLGERATRPYFDEGGPMSRTAADSGVFSPTWFDRNTPEFAFDLKETFFLTWKTEESEAKVRKFEDAKADVAAAWKRLKARELAETAAKDLQKKVTDKGITVVEAGGNGNENFDLPIFNGTGLQKDSGAIVVGAGVPPTNHRDVDGAYAAIGVPRSRIWFSNYGKIVNVQAWGWHVTTLAYGDAQGGSSENA